MAKSLRSSQSGSVLGLRCKFLHCFALFSCRYRQRETSRALRSIHFATRIRILSRLRIPGLICCAAVSIVQGQGRSTFPKTPIPDSDLIKECSESFFRGRIAGGRSSAELRCKAYQAKLPMRAQPAAASAAQARSSSTPGLYSLDCARSSPRWPPTPARWLEPCACSPRQILSQPPVTVWRILRADEPPQQRGRWHLQRQPQHAGTPPKRPATTLSSP
jgi:hypothetical protein